MKAAASVKSVASVLGGICVFGEGSSRICVDVETGNEIEPAVAHLVCGGIDNWGSEIFPDVDSAVQDIASRRRTSRAVSNIEICMIGVSEELECALLVEVENFLKSEGSSLHFESLLLCAPLQDATKIARLVETALSNGLGAVGGLLERIRESQPQIQRIADRWLMVPDHVFSPFPGGRQRIWRLAVTKDLLLKTRDAVTSRAVEAAWQSLVFEVVSPAERSVISKAATAFAQSLFPTNSGHIGNDASRLDTKPERLNDWESEDVATRLEAPRGRARTESRERALKQVDAIVHAVSQGRDADAKRFLNDLRASQLKLVDGETHHVKSLCNIARQCVDMFRTDFEYECLTRAVEIQPHDGRTLFQLADHYKRVGRFDDAIKMLSDARTFGDSRMAMSNLGAVYVRMGRFEDAINVYNEIPGSDTDSVIRTAKADALRQAGDLNGASREYDAIIRDGLNLDRASAGKAEVAKRQGRAQDACDIYENVLRHCENLEEGSEEIYRLAFAQVLVRVGKFTKAYKQVDQVVQMRPFSQQAKTFRAAIEGLLGRANEAIFALPAHGQTHAFNEWVGEYTRGLLFLMVDRYAEAQKSLLQKVESRLLDSDSEAILRLGAAACFLRTNNDVERAREYLAAVPETNDLFVNLVRSAFDYHVATSLRQHDDIKRLEAKLHSVADADLMQLTQAIRHEDWTTACRLEIKVLLRLAT